VLQIVRSVGVVAFSQSKLATCACANACKPSAHIAAVGKAVHRRMDRLLRTGFAGVFVIVFSRNGVTM
jgi:hypothetical protein